jgi:glutathione synthase/RimK-type ligase-like ATP-grasp enzyme
VLLIVTGKDDVTADLVQKELDALGAEYLRFNTECFPTDAEITLEYRGRSVSGYLRTGNRQVDLNAVSTVWFRKPNPPSVSDTVSDAQARKFALQESEAALSGFYRVLERAFWVSRPDAIRRANDKLHQLATALALGFDIPATLVTSDPEKAGRFCGTTRGPTVVKPLKSGVVEYPDGRLELIFTSTVTREDMSNMGSVSLAPCLLQEYVPKRYEARVTVIGSRVFAVGIDSQADEVSRVDWRRGNSRGLRHFDLELPKDLVGKCLQFVAHYGLQFSALDFVVTPDNKYVFLENNPNGQWAWLDLEVGNGMIRYMAEFLCSRTPSGDTHG